MNHLGDIDTEISALTISSISEAGVEGTDQDSKGATSHGLLR